MEAIMTQSQELDLYDDLVRFVGTIFNDLVLAAIKRRLTEDETHLLHRAADLKIMVDELI